jgi:hypothetical protein
VAPLESFSGVNFNNFFNFLEYPFMYRSSLSSYEYTAKGDT